MNIQQIVSILSNKIKQLEVRKAHHINEGDLDVVVSLDLEITETQDAIDKLSIESTNTYNED